MFDDDLVERALRHGDVGLRDDYSGENAEWVDADDDAVDLEGRR